MNIATRGGEGEVPVEARVGLRVELHPATDRWMMGDRFGTIDRLDEQPAVNPAQEDHHRVRVRLDRSGDVLWFKPSDVMPVR